MICLNVIINEINSNEIFLAFIMMKKCFFKTFLIYLDNISPVLETYSHFKRNFLKKNVTCYWIVHNERRVGIIITKISDTYLQITDLAVLKKYQNSGVGKAALKEILNKCGDFSDIRLFTIKQDERNCHFYESTGFVKVGEEIRINSRMALIEYRLKR